MAWLGAVAIALGIGLIPLLLLLFPDGRPPSRGWRPIVWVNMAVCGAWMLATALAPNAINPDQLIPNPIRWLSGVPADVASMLADVLLWPVLA